MRVRGTTKRQLQRHGARTVVNLCVNRVPYIIVRISILFSTKLLKLRTLRALGRLYTIPIFSASRTQKNKIKAFCIDHSAVSCTTCVMLTHRKCDNVQSLEKAAEWKKKSDEYKQLENSFTEMKKFLENLVKSRVKNIILREERVKHKRRDKQTVVKHAEVLRASEKRGFVRFIIRSERTEGVGFGDSSRTSVPKIMASYPPPSPRGQRKRTTPLLSLGGICHPAPARSEPPVTKAWFVHNWSMPQPFGIIPTRPTLTQYGLFSSEPHVSSLWRLYRHESSVTIMLRNLQLESLHERREARGYGSHDVPCVVKPDRPVIRSAPSIRNCNQSLCHIKS